MTTVSLPVPYPQGHPLIDFPTTNCPMAIMAAALTLRAEKGLPPINLDAPEWRARMRLADMKGRPDFWFAFVLWALACIGGPLLSLDHVIPLGHSALAYRMLPGFLRRDRAIRWLLRQRALGRVTFSVDATTDQGHTAVDLAPDHMTRELILLAALEESCEISDIEKRLSFTFG